MQFNPFSRSVQPWRVFARATLLAALVLGLTMPARTFAAPAPNVNAQAAPRAASSSSPTPPSHDRADFVQFTSGGHVLGFAPHEMYAAGGSHALHIEFVNAKPIRPATAAPQSDTARAAPLAEVTYPDLWPGITLGYDAPDGSIVRSTYRLDPFADAGDIRLRYNAPVRVDEAGKLRIAFETGEMIESAPIAWQEIQGQRVPVDASFRLRGQEVTFALGAYDPRHALTIDPMLLWNTFLGGSGTDYGNAIAVDGSGNVYVAGNSDATWGSPVRAYTSGVDAFVAKLDSSGTLTWNTFLGESGTDNGNGISVNAGGTAVYVGGDSTATWGSPVRAYTGGGDAFAARLNSSGALFWNTFLGGSGIETGRSIILDGCGNSFITGSSNATWGSPVRAYTSGVDAFAAKMNSSGALNWSTFLGGSGFDDGRGIAVWGCSFVYVAGTSTATWDSPVRAYSAGYDAFAAMMDYTSGVTYWNTFLGGSGDDRGTGIAVDGTGTPITGGNVHVAGSSDTGWGSPVRAHTGGFNAFAARLYPSGTLAWNTFLGGSDDYGNGIAVDAGGTAILMTGYSAATWGSPERAYTGSFDAFAAKVNSSGALTWNTFLGGSGSDTGNGIAVDGVGNVYVAGQSDVTWGSPVRTYTSSYDAFVAKLCRDACKSFLPLILR